MTSTRIVGASVVEQDLYDHLTAHVASELGVLQGYQRLAQESSSPAVRYLATMILADERRHHEMLAEIAQTVRTTAELSGEPTPIPELGNLAPEREQILAATEQYLAFEKQDQKELDRLAKEMHDVEDTTLWVLLLRIMRHDNDKHRMILQFLHDAAKRSDR